EVSGVLLKHAQTQSIFQRDPAKDIIESTDIPIKFIKVLQDFTGMDKASIEMEWKERSAFLQQLVKRGIRDQFDVKKATQQYTLRKGAS
ncbi:MAG: hypothetical protein NTW59_03100, partial [Candidatus Diapherotrites archaeon]|nr:hypothetical protein [Candidatus Diapherotrites archaeon]